MPIKKTFWDKKRGFKQWIEVITTLVLFIISILGLIVFSKVLVKTGTELLLCPDYGTVCRVYTPNNCGKDSIKQCCLRESPSFGVKVINKGIVTAANLDIFFELEGFKPNCINGTFVFSYTSNDTKIKFTPLHVGVIHDTTRYLEREVGCNQVNKLAFYYFPKNTWYQRPFEYHIPVLKPGDIGFIEFNIPKEYILKYPTKIKYFIFENEELKKKSTINIEYQDELDFCGI